MYQAISSWLRNPTKLMEAEITSVIVGVDENEAISMRRKSNVINRNGGRKDAIVFAQVTLVCINYE
jgi:hypothetical protein